MKFFLTFKKTPVHTNLSLLGTHKQELTSLVNGWLQSQASCYPITVLAFSRPAIWSVIFQVLHCPGPALSVTPYQLSLPLLSLWPGTVCLSMCSARIFQLGPPPFHSHFLSCREVAPSNTARGSGEHCNVPQGLQGRALAEVTHCGVHSEPRKCVLVAADAEQNV